MPKVPITILYNNASGSRKSGTYIHLSFLICHLSFEVEDGKTRNI